MEIKRKVQLIILSIFCVTLLCGCAKSYADFPNKWSSDDGIVIIDPVSGTATISHNAIDQTQNINVLSDSGMAYLHFCYGEIGAADMSDCIWEVEARVKGKQLFLRIVKDNVTSMEGRTIILEQVENEE